MTCKEKLRLDHPEMSEFEFGMTIGSKCPGDFGYPEDPSMFCRFEQENCIECWGQEYTGGDIADKPDPIGKFIEAGIKEEVKKVQMSTVYGEMKEPYIKDSGDRTVFSTGSVRDMHTGKGDMASIPWEAVLRLSKHYENGAAKYERWNFRKGIPVSSFIDSACRHLAKYQCGRDDEDHLAAAAFNVLGAMLMETTKPEMQDLPLRKDKRTFDYFAEES